MRSCLITIYIFAIHVCAAQEIRGKLTDSLSNPIPLASVVVKERDSTGVILGNLLARNGYYSIKFKTTSSPVAIEIKAVNYTPGYHVVNFMRSDTILVVDFILNSIKQNILNEIVISAKKYPFKQKEDTVVFDVSAYTDANSRKIEDILKKLPGIEVNKNTGEIKYKGKSIETVTIDGDNLFGFNYALGTKNISVDMVDQIEAIERYSDNPLMKGIENSDKVALNLKIKKGKLGFSGDVEGGVGFKDKKQTAHHIKGTFLGVTSYYKSFVTLTANNIGINHTPFNYSGTRLTPEKVREKNFFAPRIVEPVSTVNMLDENRSNLNNQFFASFNSVFKFSSKLSATTNFYYLTDRNSSYQYLENQNIVNGQSINWYNSFSLTKNPSLYRGDLNLKYNASSTILLDYNIKFWREPITLNSAIKTSSTLNLLWSSLSAETLYLNQSLLVTKRLSGQKAFQLRLTHSVDDIKQAYSLLPSIIDSSIYAKDIQRTNVKKTIYEAMGIFSIANGKSKYTATLGANRISTPISSWLNNYDPAGEINTFSENDIDYTTNQFFNIHSYSLGFHRLNINPTFSIRYQSQDLYNYVNDYTLFKDNFVFEPSIAMQYSLSENSFLRANANFNQRALAEKYLYTNSILINNRTLSENAPELTLQKRYSYQLVYLVNDLYNQFQLNISTGYSQTKGNYFEDVTLNKSLTILRYSFLNLKSDDINSNFNASKFVPYLSSTFQLGYMFSYSKYYNIINNSDLRNNKNYYHNAEMTISTAFDTPVNFTNTLRVVQNVSSVQTGRKFMNTSYVNSFTLNVTPVKNWLFTSTIDYFLPDKENRSQNYIFIDALLQYRPNEKKYETGVTIKNILNESTFTKVDTNDYSTIIYRTNIIPRYWLLYFMYRF